jgi:hypothetical protein
LPEDADPELIRGDPDMLEGALAIDSACEMSGSMVFEGGRRPAHARSHGGWLGGAVGQLTRRARSDGR